MGLSIRALLHQAGLPRLEAEMILAAVLKQPRTWVMTRLEYVLSADAERQVCELFKRRALGEPMAYLLAMREFYGLEFTISPAVLIPRPETELLVEQALARLSGIASDTPKRLLELGVGSGAVAISVKKMVPETEVTASDISAEALRVADGNMRKHRVNVRLLCGDWFEPLHDECFDVIVSNPPYIAEGDAHLEQGDLRYEPRAALTDGVPGAGGLAALSHIIGNAPRYLSPGGWLLLEHGYDQASSCRVLMREAGFECISSERDLAGIERVTAGRWSGTLK